MSAGRRTADDNIAALVPAPGPVLTVERPLTRIAYPRVWVPAFASPHGDRARPFPPTRDHGPPCAHFGNIRGTNEFEDHEVAIILGRANIGN